MRELEIARSRIRQRPHGDAERTLYQVMLALETGSSINTADIYALDYDDFNLAIDILRGWRLHRYSAVAHNGVRECIPFVAKRDMDR